MFWNPVYIDKYKLDEIDQKESSPNESSGDELYDPSLIDNNNNLPYYFIVYNVLSHTLSQLIWATFKLSHAANTSPLIFFYFLDYSSNS